MDKGGCQTSSLFLKAVVGIPAMVSSETAMNKFEFMEYVNTVNDMEMCNVPFDKSSLRFNLNLLKVTLTKVVKSDLFDYVPHLSQLSIDKIIMLELETISGRSLPE